MKLFVVLINLYACVFSLDYYGGVNSNISAWEHIWAGDNITVVDKTKAEVPKNSTFFDLMVEAAKHGSNFEFEYIDQYKGHSKFITKIGVYQQIAAESLYWRLYILDKAPNKNNPPGKKDLSPLSVGRLIVEDNKHYLWWLKLYDPKE